ncbi:probable WRKY transcription factor 53 [Henckelia pumila]|uniref:probable WRKY transcription factor 53 n=1 Tax=Henckelia pumila TaxID=405737 RepID=UPI003C6EA2F3
MTKKFEKLVNKKLEKMENYLSDVEKRNLVQELSEGREVAKQLHIHLLQSSSRPEAAAAQVLLNQISTSFEQALSLLNPSCNPATAAAMLVADPPPPSLAGSPDLDSQDQANRKRRWTRKVELSGDTGIEGQLDDGYGWRKYGQKDILGAKYPRGYYRCTHRYGQGCLATKQIQRSDTDPKILDITYSGIHTCDPAAPNDPPIPIIHPQTQLEELSWHQNNHPFPPESHQHFFNFQTSLNLHTYSFPSSSNIQPQSFTTIDHGQEIHNLHVSESEASRINVATSTTSGVNSATLDVDFQLGIPYEFGSSFSFEHHRK